MARLLFILEDSFSKCFSNIFDEFLLNYLKIGNEKDLILIFFFVKSLLHLTIWQEQSYCWQQCQFRTRLIHYESCWFDYTLSVTFTIVRTHNRRMNEPTKTRERPTVISNTWCRDFRPHIDLISKSSRIKNSEYWKFTHNFYFQKSSKIYFWKICKFKLKTL